MKAWRYLLPLAVFAVMVIFLWRGLSLDPHEIPQGNKGVLTGLYLSKFDKAGLRKLGFGSFIEAFNAFGYALGLRPPAESTA